MNCPFCGCEIPDTNPFSLCPTCGQPFQIPTNPPRL